MTQTTAPEPAKSAAGRIGSTNCKKKRCKSRGHSVIGTELQETSATVKKLRVTKGLNEKKRAFGTGSPALSGKHH